MAVERLPFEIAKPSPDTFVTQSSEIGHGEKTVEEELDDFGEKVGNTDEEGYYLCDSQGNVVMRYTGKGFDAAKLNPRLKKEELSQSNTDEEGWFLCDSEGNVVMKFTDKGLDAAKLSQRLKIEELAQSNTEEGGAYITDANGNYIFIADSNGVNMIVSTALLNYLKSKIEGGGGGGTSYDEIGYPILDDTNPLAMLIKGRSRACLFKSWGIIGASFETAYMEVKLNGENATYTDTGYDWVTLFGQMNSVTVGNFALAGRPLRYWLTASAGLAKLQAADAMEAYVINSSTNDYDTSKYDEPVGNVNTDIDYNNPDNNAQTWVGCLAAIIQKIRIKSPRCYIFMATVRHYTTSSSIITRITPYIQAQRDVCSCFDNVYLIDMWQYGINWTDTDIKKAYLMGAHPTRNGHVYLADAFNTYIDWLIFKNPIGMRDASFVGTDYQDKNDYSQ